MKIIKMSERYKNLDWELEIPKKIITGYKNLDDKLNFNPGLYIFGGNPGVGKSMFTFELCAKMNIPYLIVTCESTDTTYILQAISRECYRQKLNFTINDVINSIYSKNIDDSLQQVMDSLNLDNFSFMYCEKETDIDELLKTVEKWCSLSSSPNIVVIDYLQRFRSKKYEEIRNSVDYICESCKDLQLKLNNYIILISSLSRLGELKESKGIEYSSDVAIKLRKEKSVLVLDCIKNRFGKSGWEVEFNGLWEYGTFSPKTY